MATQAAASNRRRFVYVDTDLTGSRKPNPAWGRMGGGVLEGPRAGKIRAGSIASGQDPE